MAVALVDLLPMRSNVRLLPHTPGTIAVIVTSIVIVALCAVRPRIGRALEMRTDVVSAGQWWRPLTSLFPHTGGWAHLSVNVVLIYLYAPQLERLAGTTRFLVIYLGAGTLAMALMYLVLPPGRTAGASGALLAIVGALLAAAIFGDDAGPAALGRALTLTAALLALSGLSAIGGVGAAAGPGLPGFSYGVLVHALGLVAGLAVGSLCIARRSPVPLVLVATAIAILSVLVLGTWRWPQHRLTQRAATTPGVGRASPGSR